MFGKGCSCEYENRNRRDSGEDGSPKEKPEVLGSLTRFSNLVEGRVFSIPRLECRDDVLRLDNG